MRSAAPTCTPICRPDGRRTGEHTLADNQRSVAPLLDAFNALFGAHPQAFMLPGLDYHPVRFGAKKRQALGDRSATPRAALTLWTLPHDAPLRKAPARDRAAGACAGEIARLLAASQRGEIDIEGRPLAGGDIAVLVRSRAQGSQMRAALAALGVASVELAADSVFDGVDAEALTQLLAAMLEPGHGGLLRAALATDAMGWDATALAALDGDDPRWADLVARFAGYRDLWRQRGLAATLRQWLAAEGVHARLLARPDGERRLTNLLHLAELLQQAEREHPSPEALWRWLQAQRGQGRSDDAVQLRLESDRHLVQVVTIHKSKGLEYPVVFCPFLWDGHALPGAGALPGRPWHREDGRAVLDHRPEVDAATKARIKLEQAAETLRLIYVALTRAVHRCHLVVGPYAVGTSTIESGRSLLNWLVAGAGHAPAAWLQARDITPAMTHAAWQAWAGALATQASLQPLPDGAPQALPPDRPDAARIAALPVPAVPAGRWVGSFSALASGVRHDWAAVDHDARARHGDQLLPPALAADDILRFPRGPAAGDLLHAVFEHADFTTPAHWPQAIASALREQPLPPAEGDPAAWPPMIARMLHDVLHTPLPGGLQLSQVAPSRRLVEWEFMLPAAALDAPRLTRLLQDEGWPMPPLAFATLAGPSARFRRPRVRASRALVHRRLEEQPPGPAAGRLRRQRAGRRNAAAWLRLAGAAVRAGAAPPSAAAFAGLRPGDAFRRRAVPVRSRRAARLVAGRRPALRRGASAAAAAIAAAAGRAARRSGDMSNPAQWLAEGFAEHVAGWARDRGGDEALLRRAAFAISQAVQAGHVCLDLAELGDAATLEPELRASGLVGSADDPGAMPLVLDDDGRLYLHRQFAQERALARELAARATGAPAPVGAAARRALRELFGEPAGEFAADGQRLAAALALQRRLLVVSGGPGTGKTTLVVRLLAALRAQMPGLRVALAAPTGKAAARLTDALQQRSADLPPTHRDGLSMAAQTVHRLLGLKPDGRADFDADRPLPLDLLVVDEASMLDLALAHRLLAALPPQARLVLLGDKDQLAAVESGAVFAELAAQPAFSGAGRAALAELCGVEPDLLPPAADAPLPDTVLWLTKNHRFGADSGVGRLAAAINAGRGGETLQALRDGGFAGVQWLDEAATPLRQALLDAHAGYLEQVARDPTDVAASWRAFGRVGVLAALREGPRGVVQANEWIARQARSRLGGVGDAPGPWFPGRPVMVLRNDPLLQLFNGDLGLALPDAQGVLQVWFPAPGELFRAVAPARLPPHETAFALTIHKSQGSEFDRVLVLLPAGAHRVLTRELLYTAVTRAREGVTLAGGADALAAAIGTPTRRVSGLPARIAEAVGAR